MATQGLIDIVSNGRMAFKIVAGCDGYNVPTLARRLRRRKRFTLDGLYRAAVMAGVGCVDDLVVMDAATHRGPTDLNPRYRDTFAREHFNPRWECGLVDFYERVEIVDARRAQENDHAKDSDAVRS